MATVEVIVRKGDVLLDRTVKTFVRNLIDVQIYKSGLRSPEIMYRVTTPRFTLQWSGWQEDLVNLAINEINSEKRK